MTWTLTIIGECRSDLPGMACMCVPVSDYVHNHSAAADTVEQLVCEEFHDTYPDCVIRDIGWAHKEETK